MTEKKVCPSCGAEIAPDGTAKFSLDVGKTREAELEHKIGELEKIILSLQEEIKSGIKTDTGDEIPFLY